MNVQQKYWICWQICILMILNLHGMVSSCNWKHETTTYDEGSCETTTVLCKNITMSTLEQFHQTAVSEDCDSKRCYAVDVHDSDIYSINKSTIVTKLSCKLYEIILTNDDIHTIAPDTFSANPKLWHLNLENNKITTTDFFVGDFNNLRILNLGFNNLKNIKSTDFNKLKNLDKLYLNNNNLNLIEDEAFKNLINLNFIKLNNNNLQIITKNMFLGLNKLNYLFLQDNPIKIIIPEAFSSLNNLIFLDLSGSNIDTLQNNSFIGLEHLESLNLTNLNLKNIEPGAFNTMAQLEALDLHKNNLEIIKEKTFFNLEQLKSLDLSYNKISGLNLESFTGLINLRKLSLNDNLIKEFPVGTFESFPLLEKLQLGNNYLSRLERGSFSNLVQLKYLNLSHNIFSELDVVVLFSLRSLTSLKLDNNHLTSLNHELLLMHLPKLGFISIDNNDWTCILLENMLKAFKIRKIEYFFAGNLQLSQDNVEGILCTNRTVQDNSTKNNNNNNNNTDKIENILKELIDSTYGISKILNNMKATIDEISHDNTKNIENDKKFQDILNISSNTKNSFKELQGNFNGLSFNIKDSLKNIENNLENIVEFMNNNQEKYLTEEKFLEVISNFSKINETTKIECNYNYGLYIICVFILILFTIIIVLLGIKCFQTNNRNYRKTRSEIELFNASS